MSLDRTQPWQAITFRNDPQEYAFTHAVFVKMLGDKTLPNPTFEVSPALCGKELPENMLEDIESFGAFINTNWLSCPACQLEVNKAKR